MARALQQSGRRQSEARSESWQTRHRTSRLKRRRDIILQGNYIAADGTDTRNYGGTRGIQEARELGALIMGVPVEHAIAAGNSSLSIMHLVLRTAMDLGLWGDERRWSDNASETNRPKLLAPVPGYDRHFVLTKHFGIDLIPIPMTADGLIWRQPMQRSRTQASRAFGACPSIPATGCTYGDDIVKQIAALASTAATDDFVVLWDNAYAVHDLYEQVTLWPLFLPQQPKPARWIMSYNLPPPLRSPTPVPGWHLLRPRPQYSTRWTDIMRFSPSAMTKSISCVM